MKFADLVSLISQEIPPEAAARLCLEIVKAAGGETIYVPSRWQAAPPVILPTDTPRRVQERYQVSRRTAYSWMARWRQ